MTPLLFVAFLTFVHHVASQECVPVNGLGCSVTDPSSCCAAPPYQIKCLPASQSNTGSNECIVCQQNNAGGCPGDQIGSGASCCDPSATCQQNLGSSGNAFTCQPTCPSGSLCGDPVITGYDGRAFDFKGKPDKFFNIICERNHLINAKFVDAELKNHPGNFMGELGFKYKNHTVKAVVDHDGNMKVEIEGKAQPFAPVHKQLSEDLLIEIEPHFPQIGHIVVITTPIMVFRAEAIRPFDDPYTGHNRGYLNILSILRDHPSGLHGVLGQTAYNAEVYPLGDLQFHGLGEEGDYEVPSLFADTFKYNTYTFTQLEKAGTRRALAEHKEPDNKLMVAPTNGKPLYAGHASMVKHFQ